MVEDSIGRSAGTGPEHRKTSSIYSMFYMFRYNTNFYCKGAGFRNRPSGNGRDNPVGLPVRLPPFSHNLFFLKTRQRVVVLRSSTDAFNGRSSRHEKQLRRAQCLLR